MAQSENLLPFVLGDHRAPVPSRQAATRQARGRFTSPRNSPHGFHQTARRFTAINTRLQTVGAGKTLE